jgi:hypothetical protein
MTLASKRGGRFPVKSALSVIVAALALTFVPLGAAEISYSDPAGDSGSAPDITTVTVSNTEAGVVTVRIAVPLEPWSMVLMAIDSDRDPSTGDEFGLEGMVAAVNAGGVVTAIAADEDGDELPGVSIPATFVDGVLEVSFPREAFSIDQGFAFGFISAQIVNGEPVLGDLAPADPCMIRDVRCSQLWVYELTGVAPAPPPTPVVVKPVIGKPVAAPKQPIAGKRFTVRLPVTRSDDGTPLTKADVACTTKVAGKVVPHRHTFRNGTLKTSLSIPKTAKGKRLKIAVKVAANKQVAKKVLTYKIR